MIREAGAGVAMGNAAEEVKAVAGMVVASNDADGVSEALLRLLRQRAITEE
jgi:hydroxymethylpyrimidine pyrophosphatase-like HAD family hydrolase